MTQDKTRSPLDWYSVIVKDYKAEDFIYIELKALDEADARDRLGRYIRGREYIKIDKINII